MSRFDSNAKDDLLGKISGFLETHPLSALFEIIQEAIVDQEQNGRVLLPDPNKAEEDFEGCKNCSHWRRDPRYGPNDKIVSGTCGITGTAVVDQNCWCMSWKRRENETYFSEG